MSKMSNFDTLTNITQLSGDLYDSLNDSLKDSYSIITKIFSLLCIKINEGNWNNIIYCFHNIILSETTLVKNNQSKIFRLIELIDAIRDNHYHQNVSTESINVEYYSKTKTKTISCIYHEESLFVHSILAMLIAINHALLKNMNPVIAGLTGLLHDIGKPACLTQYGDYLGYPFHGEYGACILSRLMSSHIEKSYLSKIGKQLLDQ